MVIVGLLSWWYTAGWRQRLRFLGERLARAFDTFSIDLLIKTWFSPFRQISAGRVQGPLVVQLRAFADRLISRMIGGVIRTGMIVFGSLWLLVVAIAGVIELVFWACVPFLPIIGALLMAVGWVPKW